MGISCKHVFEINAVTPNSAGCEECVAAGDWWVHLRLCLTCGHVGCCDSSKNSHATKHFRATDHPVMRSLEPDEDWGWCYVDQLLIEPAPRVPGSGETRTGKRPPERPQA